MRRIPRPQFTVLFILLLGVAPLLDPRGHAAETHAEFTADGAWCWFSDPRAVYHDGRVYAGWMTADGSVQVGAWDPAQPANPAASARSTRSRPSGLVWEK